MPLFYGRGNNAAIRRITRNGKSHTVGLPTSFIRSMKLTLRDFVLLRLVRGDSYFTVRRADAHVPEVRDPGNRRAVVLAYRKVVKNGNGRMVSVPQQFRAELNLFRGDEVLLALADDRQSFTVRAFQPRQVGPPEPPHTTSSAEILE